MERGKTCWLFSGIKKIPFAPTTYAKNIDEIEWAIKRRGWPKISESNVETFHRIAAVEIKGPAKLYRVVDPESRADGLLKVLHMITVSYY